MILLEAGYEAYPKYLITHPDGGVSSHLLKEGAGTQRDEWDSRIILNSKYVTSILTISTCSIQNSTFNIKGTV
jgi:hypothetical protein